MSRASVEYTLLLPTAYHDGRDHLELPALADRGIVLRRVRSSRSIPRMAFVVDGVPVGRASRSREGYRKGGRRAWSRGTVPRPWTARWPWCRFLAKRFLIHQRIEAARRFSPSVPLGAGVVVILDASRSITDEDMKAEIAAAEAYLGHFKEAKAAVLTFDREVHAWHDSARPRERGHRRSRGHPHRSPEREPRRRRSRSGR